MGRTLRACLIAALCFACGSDAPSIESETSALVAASHEGGTNEAPVIRSLRLEPAQPTLDDLLRAEANVVDVEGDEISLTYEWTVDGEPVLGSGPEINLSGASPGSNIQVTAIANDGMADSEPVDASTRVIDRPPVLNGVAIEPTRRVYPGDAISVSPTASDPDGDLVDFRFEWFVNDQPAASAGGTFSSEALKQGDRIRVRVVALDGSNESRPWESADILVGSAHPEIVSNPPGFMDGGVYRYEVEAHDPDGDGNLRFELATAPDGMRIDEVLGVIEWRPGEKQMGVHPVSVVVRDSSKLETTQRFEVTVSETPPASAAPEQP